MTVPSDGAAGRVGPLDATDGELRREVPVPRSRRRASVLTSRGATGLKPRGPVGPGPGTGGSGGHGGAPRARQHARRVSGPEPGPRHRPGPASGSGSAPAPAASTVAPGSAAVDDQAVADERWSREWMGARRRQHRARLGVFTGLALAAGLTVLALLTARSPTSTGPQTTSIVLTPEPAVGTAGLVPAPQPPPPNSGPAGAPTP
jgi:hypothetical protein